MEVGCDVLSLVDIDGLITPQLGVIVKRATATLIFR